MVLTCSIATNNHIGEEPCIVAFERQVQILVVAVERLTKQNHDLEEQLCQRDAGPNSHGEEQKAPMSKGGTEKYQRAAMPQVGRSDKIPSVRRSQIWHHHIWLRRCR